MLHTDHGPQTWTVEEFALSKRPRLSVGAHVYVDGAPIKVISAGCNKSVLYLVVRYLVL